MSRRVVYDVASIPDPDAFWDYVRASGDCWVWTGPRLNGYGRVSGLPYTETLAHRLSWTMANGPIPADLWVLHHCDNPPCIRPDHLFLGTCADNVHDSMAKGRRPTAAPRVLRGRTKDHCLHGHRFTPELEIRFGDGRRRCRECARQRTRDYRVRKAA